MICDWGPIGRTGSCLVWVFFFYLNNKKHKNYTEIFYSISFVQLQCVLCFYIRDVVYQCIILFLLCACTRRKIQSSSPLISCPFMSWMKYKWSFDKIWFSQWQINVMHITECHMMIHHFNSAIAQCYDLHIHEISSPDKWRIYVTASFHNLMLT